MEKGFTFWARTTLDSEIFFYKPDKWFKIWFYIVNKVSYKDTKLFKRGEGLMTYKDISDNTKATKDQIDKCIRFLKKSKMATTRKTTRGMVVSVVNYAAYQDVESYKSDTPSEIKAKRKRNGSDTIQKKEKKEKKEKKKKGDMCEEDFEEFWKKYPNKKKKKDAKEKFMKLPVSILPDILEGLDTQLGSEDWKKENGRFVPMPTTWINGERWNDVVDVDISEKTELSIEEMRERALNS